MFHGKIRSKYRACVPPHSSDPKVFVPYVTADTTFSYMTLTSQPSYTLGITHPLSYTERFQALTHSHFPSLSRMSNLTETNSQMLERTYFHVHHDLSTHLNLHLENNPFLYHYCILNGIYVGTKKILPSMFSMFRPVPLEICG